LLDGAAVPFERETEPQLPAPDTVSSGSIELIRRGFKLRGTSRITRRSIGRATPFQAGLFQGIMAGLSLPPPSDKLLARETSPPRLDGCTLGYDWAL